MGAQTETISGHERTGIWLIWRGLEWCQTLINILSRKDFIWRVVTFFLDFFFRCTYTHHYVVRSFKVLQTKEMLKENRIIRIFQKWHQVHLWHEDKGFQRARDGKTEDGWKGKPAVDIDALEDMWWTEQWGLQWRSVQTRSISQTRAANRACVTGKAWFINGCLLEAEEWGRGCANRLRLHGSGREDVLPGCLDVKRSPSRTAETAVKTNRTR